MSTVLAEFWIPELGELKLFSPELALVGTIVSVLLVAIIAGRSGHLAAGVSLAGALATMLLTGRMVQRLADLGGSYGGMPPEGAGAVTALPMLVVDNLSVFFKLFLMLFLALVIGLWMVGASIEEAKRPRGAAQRSGGPEFFVLLLTSALGMMLMVGTLNLLVIVIAVETASLPSYAIAAGDKRSRVGAEASLKYVMFGAATAAIMVYGVSLLYGYFGTLDLSIIGMRMALVSGQVGAAAWIGLSAFLVGVAFKIAAVPFHFWCPDVFEGAPPEITTWLSVASKAAGLGLLLRIVYVLGGWSGAAVSMAPFAWGVGVVAALTCTVGNLSALRQQSVKRILAYSSIAHAGYMMMLAAILSRSAVDSNSNVAVGALVAYLFIYLVMNLGAFGVTAMVAWASGSDDLSRFTGLGRRAPWLALPMAVCLFSLVGLPPLGGFVAKWWVLVSLGEAAGAQPWLWLLVIVLVLNTAISLYYYVRIIRQMYLVDSASQPDVAVPIGGVVMVNACAVALILLGTVLINPLRQHADRLASNLYAGSVALKDLTDPEMDTCPATQPWFEGDERLTAS